MIPTVKQTYYQAFGLVLTSELQLPELTVTDGTADAADVKIVFEDVILPDVEMDATEFCTVIGDTVYFHVQNIARYAVRNGNHIGISPFAGADPDVVRLYTLGSCMGALLMQRNIVPLHGSAIVINGKAYAFVGESGAGKSTLAASLIHKGYPILSDDVIALSFPNGSAHPVVIPSFPHQKLWQESLDLLDMENKSYTPLYQRLTKFAVPVASSFHAEPVPLAGIFELVKKNVPEPELLKVNGLERLPLVFEHTYRNFLIPLMKRHSWHFEVSARLVGGVEFYRLHRPEHSKTKYDMSDLVLHLLEKGV